MKTAGTQKPIDALIDRQTRIMKGLVGYFKATFLIGLVGFSATNIVKLLVGETATGAFAVSGSLSLARLIQWALTVISELVMWLFVIWALSLIPYIAYRSFKISRKTVLGFNRVRWVQLGASIFLPVAVFALAWTTWSPSGAVADPLPQYPMSMILTPLLGGVAVCFAVIGLSRVLTPTRLELQLSIVTGVMLLAVFLTYAVGWSSVAQAALFGVLMALAYSHREVEAALQRLAIYDVDAKLAERLQELASRRDGIQLKQDEIALEQEAQELGVEESRQALHARRLVNEQNLNQQAVKVEETRTELMQKHNEVAISAYEQKLAFLSTAHDVLTGELARRLEEVKTRHVEQLKEDASKYNPQQLTNRIKEIMQEVSNDDGLPQALGEIRRQMLELTEEIQQTTIKLHDLRGQTGSSEPILERMVGRLGLLPQHFDRAISSHGVERDQLGLWRPKVQAEVAKGLDCCKEPPRYEEYRGLWIAETASQRVAQYDGLLADLLSRMQKGRVDGMRPVAGDPDGLFFVNSIQPVGVVSVILSMVAERPIVLTVSQE